MSCVRVRLAVGLVLSLLVGLVLTAPAAASPNGVVISEFRFRGPTGGNDEFVELLNTSARDVNIGGWRLQGCASTNGAASDRTTVPGGKVLAPGQHYLFTNTGFSGSAGDRSYGTGISDNAGARIVTSSGSVIDGVAASPGPAAPCREGTGLAIPTSNGDNSFERKALGTQDTDNNAADFVGPKPGSPTASTGPTGTLAVKIHEIQGDGAESPLAGKTVVVQGVVTGVDDEVGYSNGRRFADDAGIFVQEETSDWDSNAGTSEGIFIGFVSSRMSIPLGSIVRVEGRVTEKFGLTQINETINKEPEIVATGGALPAPVAISADAAALQPEATKPYYESLEGMRVELASGTANSGGTNKFGELFLTPGNELDRVFRTDAAPALIATDNDAGAGDPPIPPLDPDGSTSVVNADLFDHVAGTVGPMTYGFANFRIMVQPSLMPVVTKGPTVYPYTGPAPLGAYQMRVASFNVENFFPVGGSLDGGTVSEAEYVEKRERIADAINRLLLRPDVVAIQEAVDLASLQDLANHLGGYTAYLEEGNDNRGIDVGFLVKDTVTASNVRQLGKDAPNPTSATCSDVAGLLFDRPPLAVDITAGAIGFTLFSNHFSSKAAPDACRAAQAAFVRDQVQAIEAAGGQAIVAGDLNAFEDESALTTLQDGTTTLTNLWNRELPEERYSFAFQGRLQTLDHVLVTDGLDVRIAGFDYNHFDNDYYERALQPDGHKVSDHDSPTVTISTDACLNGDDRATVFVGDTDTGVANDDTGDGCTIGDLIVEDAPYRNHGQWVSHVAVVTAQLEERGFLTGREKGAIQRAAAQYKL